MHHIRFRLGLRPILAEGDHGAPPDLLGLKGPSYIGKAGKKESKNMIACNRGEGKRRRKGRKRDRREGKALPWLKPRSATGRPTGWLRHCWRTL